VNQSRQNRIQQAERRQAHTHAIHCQCAHEVRPDDRTPPPRENVWLGNIDRFEYYREIVGSASESKAAGRMLPLSKDLLRHRLDPFR